MQPAGDTAEVEDVAVDDSDEHIKKRSSVVIGVEEITTIDSEGFSGGGTPFAAGCNDDLDGQQVVEENFTDPIFESELAEFKLRLA